MADREIRSGGLIPLKVVTILPQREGFSPQGAGAIGLLVHQLADAQDIVLGGAGQEQIPFAAPRFVGVTPQFWPPWRRDEDRYAAEIAHLLREINPDVIEVHNRARLAMRIARLRPGSKMILFLHNDPQTMRGAKTPAQRAQLLRTMQVACVSQSLAGRFSEGVTRDLARLHVLENAIELAALPEPVAPEKRAQVFLFAGRPVQDKGVDAFVDALIKILPKLPQWSAEIIGAPWAEPGSPDTPFLAALRPRAEAAGIHFTGYLPHREVLSAMSRAAIVVVPSRWNEPFGLTALEAMACGAALICSKHGGLPEVAGDAAMYADPDEPGALESAMWALAENLPRREAMGEAGIERSRKFDAQEARAALRALRAEICEMA